MKKLFIFLGILLLAAGNSAAQMRVQGIPYFNPKMKTFSAEQPQTIAATGEDFTFDDIDFWIGEGENRAALVVQWTDDRETTALAWGYRWDGESYGDDMVKAIAEADPRFYVLFGGPTGYGLTIGGMGYDLDNDGDIALYLDNEEYPLPNGYYITGNMNYDYDSWSARDADDLWGSGWYQAFWSYWVKDDASSEFSFAQVGASTRKLKDGSWDGWNFEPGMTLYPWKPFAPAPEPATSYNEGILFLDKENTLSFLTKKGNFEYDVFRSINGEAIDGRIQTLFNFGGYTYILTDKRLITATEKGLEKSDQTETQGFTSIAGISPDKLYLYGNKGVGIYDLENKKISGTFTLNSDAPVRQIVVAKGSAYILQNNRLSIVDTKSDRLITSFNASYETLIQDCNGCIWGIYGSSLDCIAGEQTGKTVAFSSMSHYTGKGQIVAHAKKNYFWWISGQQIIRFDTDNAATAGYPFFSCEEEGIVPVNLCLYYKKEALAILAEDTLNRKAVVYLLDVESGDLLDRYESEAPAILGITADIAPKLSVEGSLTLETNSDRTTLPFTAADDDNAAILFNLTATTSENAPFRIELGDSLTVTPIADKDGSGSITLQLVSNGRKVEKQIGIRVKRSLQNFAFTADTVSLNPCDTLALRFTFLPENATDKHISLRSSNSYSGVEITEDERIVGLRNGSYKLYATADDNPELKDTLIVEVSAVALDSVVCPRDTITVLAGAKDTFLLRYYPQNATSKSTTYKIADTDIATVTTNTFSSWDSYSRAVITGKKADTTLLQAVVKETKDTLRIPVVVLANPVTGMTIDHDTVDLIVPKTQRLEVSVTPNNAANKSAIWTTSDESVATLSTKSASSYCTVTAKSAGTAIIRATSVDGGFVDSCLVRVTYIPLDSFTIAIPDQPELYEKGTSIYSFTKTFYPEDASDKTLRWHSSDDNVATVSTTGTIKIQGKGNAVITAISNANPALRDSLIIAAVDTIYPTACILDKHESYLQPGRTEYMSYTLEPGSVNWRKQTFLYESAADSIATVSTYGYVKGEAIGDVWVRITCMPIGLVDSCLYHIAPLITEIGIQADTTRLVVGDTLQLQAKVYPERGNPVVTWLSHDKATAAVDDNGSVVALKAGTVEISATATDGSGIIGKIELTIENQQAQELHLSAEADSLKVGEKMPLLLETLPANTTNKRVWWSSSNPDIALVSSTGTVEGLAEGTVTITAINRDNMLARDEMAIRIIAVETDPDVDALTSSDKSDRKIYIAQNTLHIENAAGETVMLYNSNGIVLLSAICHTTHETFGLNVPAGLYIVKVGNFRSKLSIK